MPETHRSAATGPDQPQERVITVNQAVAYNLARWRKAAGLTQQQLGERIGWSADAVSEAERSFEGKRTRQFDADLLAGIATALGVPVAALLLPPPGCTFRAAGNALDAKALIHLLLPDNLDGSDVMGAYRDEWNDTGRPLLTRDPGWSHLDGRWMSTRELRLQLAAMARAHAAAAVAGAEAAASVLNEIATGIEGGERQ